MTRLPTPRQTSHCGGFTLIEILTVIAVLTSLVLLSTLYYQRYMARARSAELALKYDAVKTQMAVAARTGQPQDQCAALAATVPAANLSSTYAAMDLAFEPVPGGFTPALRFCATHDRHGATGVAVTREAHEVLARNNAMGPGAVVSDAVVSFAMPLSGGQPLCRTAPAPAGPGACTGATAPKPVTVTVTTPPTTTTVTLTTPATTSTTSTTSTVTVTTSSTATTSPTTTPTSTTSPAVTVTTSVSGTTSPTSTSGPTGNTGNTGSTGSSGNSGRPGNPHPPGLTGSPGNSGHPHPGGGGKH